MNTLFAMRYLGQSGLGVGSIFVGNGRIVGVDAGNGRYHGTYEEADGRFRAEVTLSMPDGGALVTGAQVPAGTAIPLKADWPQDFANGEAQQVIVAGRPVHVTLERIGSVS